MVAHQELGENINTDNIKLVREQRRKGRLRRTGKNAQLDM